MKRTVLFDRHKNLNAKIVNFAGYMMPMSYSSVNEEHIHVRNKVGIFDVSHMGEFEISGLNDVDDSIIFHAGTSFNNGKIVTNGGRVLSIVSSGKTMKEALKKSYKSIDKINFEGKTFRQDIGFDL